MKFVNVSDGFVNNGYFRYFGIWWNRRNVRFETTILLQTTASSTFRSGISITGIKSDQRRSGSNRHWRSCKLRANLVCQSWERKFLQRHFRSHRLTDERKRVWKNCEVADVRLVKTGTQVNQDREEVVLLRLLVSSCSLSLFDGSRLPSSTMGRETLPREWSEKRLPLPPSLPLSSPCDLSQNTWRSHPLPIRRKLPSKHSRKKEADLQDSRTQLLLLSS